MRHLLLVSLLAVPASLSADEVRLSNGRTMTGTVLRMDQYFVQIQRTGEDPVSLPRASVVSIGFGSAPAAKPTLGQFAAQGPNAKIPAAQGQPSGITPQQFRQQMPASPDSEIARIESMFGVTEADRQQTPEQVLEKLREAGSVDRRLMAEIYRTFPLLNDPTAKQYFEGTLNGLISGEKSLQEVRADAISARDKLQQLSSVLGADGDALIGRYRDVLDRFIEQTAP